MGIALQMSVEDFREDEKASLAPGGSDQEVFWVQRGVQLNNGFCSYPSTCVCVKAHIGRNKRWLLVFLHFFFVFGYLLGELWREEEEKRERHKGGTTKQQQTRTRIGPPSIFFTRTETVRDRFSGFRKPWYKLGILTVHMCQGFSHIGAVIPRTGVPGEKRSI